MREISASGVVALPNSESDVCNQYGPRPPTRRDFGAGFCTELYLILTLLHRDLAKTTCDSDTVLTTANTGTASPPPSFDLTSMKTQSSNTVRGAMNNPNMTSERYMNPPSAERHTKNMQNAFDLLEAMLPSKLTKRITLWNVFDHPFLSEPGVDPKTAIRLAKVCVLGSTRKLK